MAVKKENSQGRDPRTREAKQPGTGTPEPVNKEKQCQQQAKFLQRNTWKRDTWRRTEHSASSQEANDNWDNKSAQDESNVIINTDQRGSCLSPRQKISETRSVEDRDRMVWII